MRIVVCRDWFSFCLRVHCVGFSTKMGSVLKISGLVSKQEGKTAKRRENESETWPEREERG